MGQWNPLHDLVTLQDRMNRLFEDATHRRAEREPGDDLEQADWYPAADVYDENDEFVVALDVPGVDRETLEISLDDNRLTVRGTRPFDAAKRHRSERPSGNLMRTFSVPTSVDQKNIRADYKDGVLQVHLPKRKDEQAGRVEIKVS